MNNPKEKDSKVKPTEPLDDDAIIELVDEIEDGAPLEPISPLEKQLLGIAGQSTPAARAADTLDLSGIRFDEEDEIPPATAPARRPANRGESISLQDAEWLLAPDTQPGAPQPSARDSNEIEEISEFDEQFLEAEGAAEGKPEAAAKPADETIELLDAEEELDNELLWFDDPQKGDESPAEPPSGLAEHEEIELVLPEDGDLGPTSAADVFAAHLESLFPEGEGSPARDSEDGFPLILPEVDAAAPSPPPPKPSLAAAAAGLAVPPDPLKAETPPALAPAGIPPEEIEAAVERVIERKLGGTIEATILRAIETAVTREIDRLKQLLLEDDKP